MQVTCLLKLVELQRPAQALLEEGGPLLGLHKGIAVSCPSSGESGWIIAANLLALLLIWVQVLHAQLEGEDEAADGDSLLQQLKAHESG